MDNYYGNICYCRRCNGVVHTIKKGDTLYLISKYYKVPIGEIMNANRNINIYNLQIGDEICIPVRRPEPRDNDMAARQMPFTNDMDNSNDMNNMQGFTSPMNTMTEEENFMQDMSDMQDMNNMQNNNMNNMSEDMRQADVMASQAENKKYAMDMDTKLSDIIGNDNMTLGEFISFVRKIDNN